MKRAIFLSLILFMGVFMLSACNKKEVNVTLDIPSSLTVENRFITFDEVENASYYNINYDGNTFNVKPSGTGKITFDASKIFVEAKTYEIKVKAVGSGKYLDSPYSEIYEYTQGKVFGRPTLTISSKMLVWTAVEGANIYTIRVTFPNGTRGYYTYSTTSFDISMLLLDEGRYTFQVMAGNVDENNDYSNEINYDYKKKLEAPRNLEYRYDADRDEIYLYFITDVNATGYIINVNDTNYDLVDNFYSTFASTDDYDNLVEVRLTSFLKSKKENFNFDELLEIKIQGRRRLDQSFESSEFSNYIRIDIKKTLEAPVINISSNGGRSVLSWSKVEGAEGYSIYKDLVFLTSVEKNVTQILLETNSVQNVRFSVKAEGVNKKLTSPFSDFVSVSNLSKSNSTTISLTAGTLQWQRISNAKYLVEIYNKYFYYSTETDATSIDLAHICDYDDYSVKVTVIEDNKLPATAKKEIKYTKKLSSPQNISIGSANSMYRLTFDAVDDAYGYVVKLNDEIIKTIFTSTQIDLTNYIMTSGQYNVYIKAVASPASNCEESNFVAAGSVAHMTRLDSPVLRISSDYILTFNNVQGAYNYTILVNYYPIFENGVAFDPQGYDISSYLTSAQKYNIMVKANANPNDPYHMDSNYSSIIVPKFIQLDTINDEDMTVVLTDGNYYLNFEKQTHAASYQIRIYRVEDDEEFRFSINSLPNNITRYLRESGTYKIYVTAIAENNDEYLYLSSSESGNPYIFEKNKVTLDVVENISFASKNENDKSLICSWLPVNNALSYYVMISYREMGEGKKSRDISEFTVTSSEFDLGNIISKEGIYNIKVKSLGSGEYESSAFSEATFNHYMTVKSDFERNTIFIGGKTISHYVGNFEDLKNLVWYYYLYNNVSYFDAGTNSDYKMKIMLGTTLEKLETECASEFIDFEKSEGSDEERLFKMTKLALESYPEKAYLKEEFSKPVHVTGDNLNYFLFDFNNLLNLDKTGFIQGGSKSNFYNEKQTTLHKSEKRNENYVFNIDKSEKVEVYNSEQLFMAVQYGKSPLFVTENSVAEKIYKNARAALLEICSDKMSDYEKVVKIYDYLSSSVEFNDTFNDLLNSNDLSTNNNGTLLGNMQYEYLEGIFNSNKKSATSNGLAKAFVLMCRIEGIEAIKVGGNKDGKDYYWNKVLVDATPNDNAENKEWFAIDIAGSYKTITIDSTSYQVASHEFFLTSDSVLSSKSGLQETYAPNSVACEKVAGYFANEQYSYNKVINRETHSGKGTLQYQTGSIEDYLKDIIRYLACESDGGYNCLIEVDVSKTNTAISTLTSGITSTYYSAIVSEFNMVFKIQTMNYDSIILIAVIPNK